MTTYEREVFNKAIKTYGDRAQITMVMEEMSELQKELCKHLRGGKNVDHIAEEIADVEIMLDQMTILFDCADRVENVRAVKVVRLDSRMAGIGTQQREWTKEGEGAT